MINAIVGLMNSGKTLYMTYKGFLAYASGKTVISNYDLSFPHKKINKDFLIWLSSKAKKEDFILEDCCFLLDELWIWLDARKNQENTISTYFFLQSSKSDTEIYLTAQDNSQNDIRLRRNLHKVSMCSRVLNIDGKFYAISDEQRFIDKKYIDNLYIRIVDMKKINIGIYSELKPSKTIYLKAKPIFNLYNTRQRIHAV